MRLKQICNHPSQWLGDGAYNENDSGKFERLREIGEAVASRQEKLLVFTQFKEIIPPWRGCSRWRSGGQGSSFMATRRSPNAATSSRRFRKRRHAVFRPLDQGRRLRAQSYQRLACSSLRSLVESGGREPATDRAYRIGQRRNVLVHKFVCRGTIEAKIDLLIESKRQSPSRRSSRSPARRGGCTWCSPGSPARSGPWSTNSTRSCSTVTGTASR